MDKDRLINLLPEEYLPEPEFKGFAIFAAVLVIVTLLGIFMQYQRDDGKLKGFQAEHAQLVQEKMDRMEGVAEFQEIQANARFIRSYLAVIPQMVLQAPDYWELYSEIERLLPEDTWITRLAWHPGRKKWHDITIECLSKGYSFSGPLNTYDAMEGSTRFENVRMASYQLTSIGGNPAASYTIHMEVKFAD